MCWYQPTKEQERQIKALCQQLVDEMHKLDKDGDPMGLTLQDITKLIEHLYLGYCPEKPRRKDSEQVHTPLDR